MIDLLVPATARVAEAFHDDPDEPVFPGEEHLIARAVPARRQEFVTARRCARLALAGLGCPPVPILAGPSGAPRWPDGVVGSITHAAGYRGAVVARITDVASIGIDAEPNMPLPPGVDDLVTVAGERQALVHLAADHPETHWDRVLFSAKESIYKAWYPLTERWLGFEDVRLAIDPAGRFMAELLVAGPLRELDGRFLISGGLILSALTIPL